MKVIEAKTPEELEKYYNLRYEVLRKPWNQPYPSTMDKEEDITMHFLILNESNEAIAAGRLKVNSAEEGQLRSMAVRSDQQGKGLGSIMAKHIEGIMRQKKLKYAVLDARENAVKFYEKQGYKVTGNSYLLFGLIQHYRMRKDL